MQRCTLVKLSPLKPSQGLKTVSHRVVIAVPAIFCTLARVAASASRAWVSMLVYVLIENTTWHKYGLEQQLVPGCFPDTAVVTSGFVPPSSIASRVFLAIVTVVSVFFADSKNFEMYPLTLGSAHQSSSSS